jgi:hypothetical protein
MSSQDNPTQPDPIQHHAFLEWLSIVFGWLVVHIVFVLVFWAINPLGAPVIMDLLLTPPLMEYLNNFSSINSLMAETCITHSLSPKTLVVQILLFRGRLLEFPVLTVF